jgi:hypothetical protein
MLPSKHASSIEFQDDYSLGDMTRDIEGLSPDLLLGDGFITPTAKCRNDIIVRQCPGVSSTIDYMQRLSHIIRLPPTEGWRTGADL